MQVQTNNLSVCWIFVALNELTLIHSFFTHSSHHKGMRWCLVLHLLSDECVNELSLMELVAILLRAIVRLKEGMILYNF